ncbi:MAG: hypothetical protein RML32_08585 [Gammaproteobacteria bacterium]|nr:hypothetical protein [Gammaproteobacteria bacterium]
MIGRRVTPPEPLRRTLIELFGPAVDRVVVVERSLYARLHFFAVATTRPRRILLRGSAAEFFDDPAIVLHEYCHVLKQWETGRLSIWRYLLESFRRGYWDNRFEVEAREFADDHLRRFCARLAQHRAALGAEDDRERDGYA